jgi:pimeloyl-ACP methyl ester carboxylesterase
LLIRRQGCKASHKGSIREHRGATLLHARLDVIDRCGHLPMVEKPETFLRLLYDFLVGVEEEIPDVITV